jgi:biotin synthase
MLGGMYAIIVGNYLSNLCRLAQQDLDMLADLKMPVKALSEHL